MLYLSCFFSLSTEEFSDFKNQFLQCGLEPITIGSKLCQAKSEIRLKYPLPQSLLIGSLSGSSASLEGMLDGKLALGNSGAGSSKKC